MKSPAFQFYAHDFLGGTVATYSIEEVGAYSLLLAFDWSLTGLPTEPEKLARLLRVSRRKFDALWATIGEQFVERDGRYFNPRLEMERAKQAAWREKSAKGGRNHGRKGGSRVVEPPAQPDASTPSPTPSPTPVEKPSPRKAAGSATTWITPYADAWLARFGGDMTIEPALRPLGKLRAKHGDEETLRRWRIYLAATDGQYANAARFASTWSEWESPTKAVQSVGAIDAAEASWLDVLDLLPMWQRRDPSIAEHQRALPEPARRGLSAVGGFRVIAETPDARRGWLKKEFVAAYHTPHHASVA